MSVYKNHPDYGGPQVKRGEMLRISLLAGLISLAGLVSAGARDEAEYTDTLCIGMLINRTLPNGTRVDCLSDTHAIEVDFTRKWAEAIGQALNYAAVVSLKPGLVLICHKETSLETCFKHQLHVVQTFAYWRIDATIWFCDAGAMKLADCSVVEAGRVGTER